MRSLLNMILTALAGISLLSAPYDTDAQVRRTTGTTGNGTTTSRTSGTTGQTRRTTGTTGGNTSSQTRRTTTSTGNGSTTGRTTGTTGQTRRTTGTTGSNTSSQTRRTTTSTGNGTTTSRTSGTTGQTRRTTGTTGGNTSSQVRRTTTSTGNGSTTGRTTGTTGQTRRTTGTTGGNTSSQTRRTTTSSGTAHRVAESLDNANRTSSGSSASSTTVRRNTNVTKGGLSTVTSQMRTSSGSSARRGDYGIDNSTDFRINDHNVQRIPPRDRDFMPYDRPGHFYGHDPHCFGYRVQMLPPRCRKVHYFGIDYYIYNDVYYRPFNGHYIICRPPFGVTFAATVGNLGFATVNFAYYSNVYRTYSAIDANNRYIDQQNMIIARNNAIIMSQNNTIALNPDMALSSYEIASRLGLVQSYAYADRNYYYEDGVFYIINDYGQYQVIVPPAGALVQNLPDDYDTLVLGGTSYYRVDDTVYRLTLIDGTPFLEVLGQMYGQLARTYNGY